MTQNEFAALKDGTTVEVSTSFTNPCADRRTRHDWRKAEVIEKGTRFVVKVFEGGDEFDPAHIELLPVTGYLQERLWVRRDGTVPSRSPFGALARLVIDTLVIGNPSLRSIAKANYCGESEFALAVVREMLRTGKLTLDEAETLYNADHNRED